MCKHFNNLALNLDVAFLLSSSIHQEGTYHAYVRFFFSPIIMSSLKALFYRAGFKYMYIYTIIPFDCKESVITSPSW